MSRNRHRFLPKRSFFRERTLTRCTRPCRLDRLVALLETGSTQSIRLTAARQLAGIASIRVSHPSAEHSGHPSLAPSVKVEDATQPVSYEGVWRGVDGEWNEVLALVARVSRPQIILTKLPPLTHIASQTGPAAAPVSFDGNASSCSFRARLHLARRRGLGSDADRNFRNCHTRQCERNRSQQYRAHVSP